MREMSPPNAQLGQETEDRSQTSTTEKRGLVARRCFSHNVLVRDASPTSAVEGSPKRALLVRLELHVPVEEMFPARHQDDRDVKPSNFVGEQMKSIRTRVDAMLIEAIDDQHRLFLIGMEGTHHARTGQALKAV